MSRPHRETEHDYVRRQTEAGREIDGICSAMGRMGLNMEYDVIKTRRRGAKSKYQMGLRQIVKITRPKKHSSQMLPAIARSKKSSAKTTRRIGRKAKV